MLGTTEGRHHPLLPRLHGDDARRMTCLFFLINRLCGAVLGFQKESSEK